MAKRLLLFSWVAVCLVCQSRPEPERFAMLMNAHFPALPGTFQTSYGQAPKQGSYQALQKPLAGYSEPYRQWAEGYAALHNAKPKIAIQALSQARQSLGPLPNLINDLALAHYKAWEAQPRLDDLVIALDLWLSLGTLPANEEAPSITLNLRRLNEKRTHTEPAGPEVLLNPLGAFLIEATPDPEPFQHYGDQSLKLWQSQQKTGYPAYAELVTWLAELDRQNLERSEDTIRALEARFRDPLGLAWFHYASGLRAYYELRPDSAVQHLNSALELAKTHGLIGLEARSEHLLGLQLTFSGAFQAALEPLAEAGATYQKLGFRSASVRMQSSVAYCLEQMGQENQAEQIKSRLIVNQWREVGLAGMDFSLFGWLMRCGRDLGAKFLVAHLEKCQLERMPKERKPIYVQQSIRLALA
ncbi:MAG: hypothetical protein KDC71_24355, partial [Acidobacteria bacterium]|nr:hypothetical protein [Acidobacteriota bacterium]